MPRKKHTHQQQATLDHYPDPEDLLPNLNLEDKLQPDAIRTGSKKQRNAPSKPHRLESSSPETAASEPDQIAPAPTSIPVLPAPTAPSQLAFPSTKSKPVDIRDELVSLEKVSDQYTPPSDEGLHNDLFGRSPLSVAVSSPTNTPPVEPGFSNRQTYKIKNPPLSPPQRNARPVSFGGSVPPLPAYPRYPANVHGSPPAPHLPQSHFYAAHDVDLGLPSSIQATSRDLNFTKFVRLPHGLSQSNHGIVTGISGGISISAFDASSVNTIGGLSGLSGTIVDAEILQHTYGPDPFADMRPLVAITTVSQEQAVGGDVQYIWDVCVRSLIRHDFGLNILRPAPESSFSAPTGLPGVQPEPRNHLKLAASGNFLVVSSGKSGEVFVFCPVLSENGPTFECLSKLWTSIQPKEQRRDSSHHRANGPEFHMPTARKVAVDENVPLLSLSDRWLAICPPVSSIHSIGAVLGDEIALNRHTGLEAGSAGTRPSVNCDVDSPDADTLLGKVTRGVAQEVVKAGKWLGDQGLQYWHNYWKKDDRTGTPPPVPYNASNYPAPLSYGNFPPTHGDTTPVQRDPEVISIFDLRSLHDPASKRTAATTPFATFKPPHGCSFLSFAPHGLALLTASRKGDYQYVWDLLETRYIRPSVLDADMDSHRNLPRVRQLARYDRLSSSTIVDVAWESPKATRFAILTKNKTVHLFDLPASALRWPPPRRVRKARPTSAPPDANPIGEHDPAPSGGFFTSAMNIAGRTQPMIASLRGRAPSTSGGLSSIGQAGMGIAAATGALGTRAVASGLSKSLGAATGTMNRIQHAGENRKHVRSDMDLGAGCLRWVRRGSKHGICILDIHGIRYWQVRKSEAREARSRDATVFDARKAVSFKMTEFGIGVPKDQGDAASYWNVPTTLVETAGNDHPLSFAEIDTNAPYQPFHLDAKVVISTYQPETMRNLGKLNSVKKGRNSPLWLFGENITTTRLSSPAVQRSDEDNVGSVILRETSVAHNAAGLEQIVSTSRRKKVKRVPADGLSRTEHTEGGSQEGFFEDDCDVLED